MAVVERSGETVQGYLAEFTYSEDRNARRLSLSGSPECLQDAKARQTQMHSISLFMMEIIGFNFRLTFQAGFKHIEFPVSAVPI
ncbi:MAG TPA: hypothetical protein PLB73_02460 [Leptospiraceae bacterium]|nr:hypothetical protein [Leptospiraceae bacterium]